MNLFRYVNLILLLFVAHSAIASDCDIPISSEAVIKLSSPITLGGLKSKFGNWCQGHGPYSWYKTPHGKQIWFWWKMPRKPATTDAEGLKYLVFFAAEVSESDSNIQKIIWPQEFVGKNIKPLLQSEYESQQMER